VDLLEERETSQKELASEFDDSGLFMRPDRYNGKDLIQGNVDKTHIRFSMVHAEEEYTVTDTETDTDSDGHTTTRTVTRTEYRDIFCGLVFSADFNKNFNGRTRVRAGSAGFMTKLFGSNILLEDPRFNSVFNVSSTDQVEARFVLTPKMMERLIDLNDKFGRVNMSFVNGRVFVAMSLSYNLFEPNLSRPLTDTTQIEWLIAQLKRITGIVDDLDLNTRIWAKGASEGYDLGYATT
jgi:hypothetical protein